MSIFMCINLIFGFKFPIFAFQLSQDVLTIIWACLGPHVVITHKKVKLLNDPWGLTCIETIVVKINFEYSLHHQLFLLVIHTDDKNM